jgi:hypothetical protein
MFEAVLGRIEWRKTPHLKSTRTNWSTTSRCLAAIAVSLDRLTNALVLVGQHGVYCTSQRNPTVPAMDLRMVVQELTHAKELMQSVMEEMRKARGDTGDV